MSTENSPLRINVGFIAHQPVGFQRDFLVEVPQLKLSADLSLEYFRMDLAVSRNYQGLLARATIGARAVVECVRCLEVAHVPLKSTFAELYAFTDRSLSESGLLYPESGVIDFRPLVRDCLILEIPINPLCKPDCLGLCPVCGENRNLNPCQHDISDMGARFSTLDAMR